MKGRQIRNTTGLSFPNNMVSSGKKIKISRANRAPFDTGFCQASVKTVPFTSRNSLRIRIGCIQDRRYTVYNKNNLQKEQIILSLCIHKDWMSL